MKIGEWRRLKNKNMFFDTFDADHSSDTVILSNAGPSCSQSQ